MSVHITFRDRLGLAMKRKGRGAMTYVALKSGYSTGYVRGLYSNNPRNPTLGTVWAIAEALEVDPLWLLGKEEHEQPQPVCQSADCPARLADLPGAPQGSDRALQVRLHPAGPVRALCGAEE